MEFSSDKLEDVCHWIFMKLSHPTRVKYLQPYLTRSELGFV